MGDIYRRELAESIVCVEMVKAKSPAKKQVIQNLEWSSASERIITKIYNINTTEKDLSEIKLYHEEIVECVAI